MKKVFWSIMLVSALFIGCSKDNSDRQPEKPTPENPDKPTPENPEQPEGPKAECDWADYLITLEYSTLSTTNYGFAEVDYSTLKHSSNKFLYELLGYDDWAEMMEDMGELGGSPETGANCLYMGNDPGTGYDVTSAFNTNGIGYWCNGVGGVQNWGDDARIYTEAQVTEDALLIATVGVMPGVIKAGETYVCRMVFQRTDGEEVTRVGIEFKVKIEEFKDPEAGKYNSANRKTGEFTLPTVEITVPINVFYGGVQADMSAVQDYLQLTKYELFNMEDALYDDDEGGTGELLKGIDVTNYVNGEAVASNAGGLGGNWMSDPTTVGAWGVETGAWFIELHAGLESIFVSVGTMPGEPAEEGGPETITPLVSALVGKTAEYKQVLTYIPDFNADPTIINMSYKISFVDAQ